MPTFFSQELRELPFVRLLFPFLAGIIFQLYFEFDFQYFPYVILSFLIVLVIINIRKFVYSARHLYGLILFVLLFFAGIQLTQINKTDKFEYPEKNIFAEAVIINQPETKANSIKTLLRIRNIKSDSLTFENSQIILAYHQKDSVSKSLNYGDVIVFGGKVNLLKNPGNPHEFDYKSYLERRKISGQIYLSSENYKLTETGKGNFIFEIAGKTRKKLAEIYKENGLEGDEFAVLSALTLGDKSELDPQIKQAYASSGAMHILAVSGLHVGIIFAILNFLLRFLDKFKTEKRDYGKIIKSVIILLVLWFFAVLSGLSPSVRRAAVMFSFFVIASVMNRNTNIYNTLAASAFVLLVYNPFLILEVGFQLSYIAVFSIVWLQPKLAGLFYIKNVALDKIWILTSVSIAAQIGATPISLFYFHQFPNFFWLSNLIVIPLAGFIVYTAAALFAFSFVPYVSDFIALILKYLVESLNFSVFEIEKLPFSVTQNISFDRPEMLIWYGIILSLLLFIMNKKVRSLHIILLFMISIFIYKGVVNFNLKTQHSFFVYNIRNKPVYNFISGNENYILSDTIPEKKAFSYAAKSNFLKHKSCDFEAKFFSEAQKADNFFQKDNFIEFFGKKLIFIDDKDLLKFETDKLIQVDFVVIAKNPYISIDEIKSLFDFETLIFDSSNKLNRISRWKEECKTLNINYFSVPEQGAFEYYW